MRRRITRWSLFLAALGVIFLTIKPIVVHETQSYVGTMTESGHRGRLQVHFQPVSRTLDGRWPSRIYYGTPFRLSVKLFNTDNKTQFVVHQVLIEGDGQQLFLLPEKSDLAPIANIDGTYYHTIIYDNVELTASNIRITVSFTVSDSSFSEHSKTVFNAKRVVRKWLSHKALDVLLGV